MHSGRFRNIHANWVQSYVSVLFVFLVGLSRDATDVGILSDATYHPLCNDYLNVYNLMGTHLMKNDTINKRKRLFLLWIIFYILAPRLM